MTFKFSKKKNSNRIVILGSSGIISINLQKFLKKHKAIFKVFGKTKINLIDKKNIIKLRNIISKKDCVVFISAEAPVKNLQMLYNNLKMADNFCNKINYNSLNHIIYVSSDAVYKDIKRPITEKSLVMPNSLHGLMHFLREKVFLQRFKDKLLIVRPTLIYGIDDTHNGYGPNQFLNKKLNKKKIELYGKGEERRDHVFIKDLIEILIYCIKKNGTGILNIASGKIFSFLKIAKIIDNIDGKKYKIKFLKRNGPMPHGGYRAFDISLLKKNFKNLKISSIQDGIKKYYIEKKYTNAR